MFTRGTLNTEGLGEEFADAGGGVPKKLRWVGVGVLDGRCMSGTCVEGDGPRLTNTLGDDAIAVGFWKLNGRETAAFTLAIELPAGAVEGLGASLELADAKNEDPPIVDDNGGVFGLLSLGG